MRKLERDPEKNSGKRHFWEGAKTKTSWEEPREKQKSKKEAKSKRSRAETLLGVKKHLNCDKQNASHHFGHEGRSG